MNRTQGLTLMALQLLTLIAFMGAIQYDYQTFVNDTVEIMKRERLARRD